MRSTLLFTLLCAALGCTDGVGPMAGTLDVRVFPPAVLLSNKSTAPVYAFVIERESIAVTDWLPCTDPSRCPGIRPGQDSTVPYAEISGYKPDAEEAIVYWWHLVPREGGGLTHDSLRVEIIQL